MSTQATGKDIDGIAATRKIPAHLIYIDILPACICTTKVGQWIGMFT
jgi:hypothetical protein